jgi:PKHD-type hydroxylase
MNDAPASPEMKLISPFHIARVFNQSEALSIISLGESTSGSPWWIGRDDAVRRSAWSTTIARQQTTEWIFERLHRLCVKANRHYGFDVEALSSDLLFARYREEDHFDWHIDLGEDTIADRKISVAVQLSDEKDFTGGAWQFMYDETTNVTSEQGGAVVFPSYLPHRVTNISSGVRYSLVGWLCGPAFR